MNVTTDVYYHPGIEFEQLFQERFVAPLESANLNTSNEIKQKKQKKDRQRTS